MAMDKPFPLTTLQFFSATVSLQLNTPQRSVPLRFFEPWMVPLLVSRLRTFFLKKSGHGWALFTDDFSTYSAQHFSRKSVGFTIFLFFEGKAFCL